MHRSGSGGRDGNPETQAEIFLYFQEQIEKKRSFVNASHKLQWLLLVIGHLIAMWKIPREDLDKALKFADSEVEDKEVLKQGHMKFKN